MLIYIKHAYVDIDVINIHICTVYAQLYKYPYIYVCFVYTFIQRKYLYLKIPYLYLNTIFISKNTIFISWRKFHISLYKSTSFLLLALLFYACIMI